MGLTVLMYRIPLSYIIHVLPLRSLGQSVVGGNLLHRVTYVFSLLQHNKHDSSAWVRSASDSDFSLL